jgi:hypothetical protein
VVQALPSAQFLSGPLAKHVPAEHRFKAVSTSPEQEASWQVLPSISADHCEVFVAGRHTRHGLDGLGCPSP